MGCSNSKDVPEIKSSRPASHNVALKSAQSTPIERPQSERKEMFSHEMANGTVPPRGSNRTIPQQEVSSNIAELNKSLNEVSKPTRAAEVNSSTPAPTSALDKVSKTAARESTISTESPSDKTIGNTVQTLTPKVKLRKFNPLIGFILTAMVDTTATSPIRGAGSERNSSQTDTSKVRICVLHHDAIETFLSLKPKTISLSAQDTTILCYPVVIPSSLFEDCRKDDLKRDQMCQQIIVHLNHMYRAKVKLQNYEILDVTLP
jgi:hypothetical protein